MGLRESVRQTKNGSERGYKQHWLNTGKTLWKSGNWPKKSTEGNAHTNFFGGGNKVHYGKCRSGVLV